MNRLAKNLKLIRKDRWRLSQDRFSSIMDSTRSKINSYENGGVEPSIAFVLKLQSYTNLSVQEIFYEELAFDQIPPFPLEGEQAKRQASASEKEETALSDLDKLLLNQKSMQQILLELKQQMNSMKDKLDT